MMRILRIGAAAAYLAMPIRQAAHLAHHAEHAVCATCTAEQRVESGISVRCAGGCGEAGHHHHAPARHHDPCAVCQASSGALIAGIGPVAIVQRMCGPGPEIGDDLRLRRTSSSAHPSRAPPAIG